tara:strand:- start:190 stop:435 length:246 start_codon:yes stop_codon:yes gene_type:complete
MTKSLFDKMNDLDNLNLNDMYWRTAESRLDKIKLRLFESPHLFPVLDSVMTELDLWDEPNPTDYARNLILQSESKGNQNGR